MKFVQRIMNDIAGSFELVYLAWFRYNHGLLTFMVSPIMIPLAFSWFLIKVAFRIITMPFRQKYPIGKIFISYVVFTTIFTFLIQLLFPGAFRALQSFEPISTQGLLHTFGRTDQLITTFSNGLQERGANIVSICLVFGNLVFLTIAALFTYAASKIPVFAYIWAILLFIMLCGFVMDIATSGYDNVLFATFRTIWEDDLKFGLWTTIKDSFEFPINMVLYGIPGLNVIVYRYRMKKDKKEHTYPPINYQGLVDQSRLAIMHNKIYSKFII